ncbi:MAG: leucine-rich repeat domain-containing protein [Tannerellaceae bacterium]|jgi:hypothetical protein|nr:leucine-rich repeat domain-containing protein [Tannerellaceae bacterium]
MKQLILLPVIIFLSATASAQNGAKAIGGAMGNLRWALSGGTLTVGGTGAMPDNSLEIPWENYREEITGVILRKGVTSIISGAFHDCPNLTSVSIPGSVEAIGKGAFSYCESLASVFISTGVKHIGESAFTSCSSLRSVAISAGVNSIGDGAFAGCENLTTITIPGSVTTIGTFAFSNCRSLTDVTLERINPLPVSPDIFNRAAFDSVTLHVPSGTKELYRLSPGWKNFRTIVDSE